jgi:hypothetical protein
MQKMHGMASSGLPENKRKKGAWDGLIGAAGKKTLKDGEAMALSGLPENDCQRVHGMAPIRAAGR